MTTFYGGEYHQSPSDLPDMDAPKWYRCDAEGCTRGTDFEDDDGFQRCDDCRANLCPDHAIAQFGNVTFYLCDACDSEARAERQGAE